MSLILKKLYYYFLDLATFRKGIKVTVNDFTLRLPARYYKYFPPVYEPINFSFFKNICRPGITCIDVGAHIGLYSVFMQKLSGGQVYSFEPAPSSILVLEKTISLNMAENKIEIISAAVSDKTGSALLRMDSHPASVSNSLVTYNRTVDLLSYEVKMVCLDDFITEKKLSIDFIKIDAEGVELSVLKGAVNTLSKQRPAMTLAMHPTAIAAQNENNEMIWDFLETLNYSIEFDSNPVSKKDFIAQKELFDVHLVPMEKRKNSTSGKAQKLDEPT